MSPFCSSNIQISYSQIEILTYVTNSLKTNATSYRVQTFLIKCTLNGYIKCNLSTEFQRGLGWSRPLLSLLSKYCLMILLIMLTYVTLSDLKNLMTTSRSISLYHTSQLKIPKQCKISSSCEFFHNLSSNFQTTFPLFDKAAHVTCCFRLTPKFRECKHPLFDAAKLYFKKEYVCKIRSRIFKDFRHILRKDNALAHLLHQVTYVTASDIKHFATNLQIYESFHISE